MFYYKVDSKTAIRGSLDLHQWSCIITWCYFAWLFAFLLLFELNVNLISAYIRFIIRIPFITLVFLIFNKMFCLFGSLVFSCKNVIGGGFSRWLLIKICRAFLSKKCTYFFSSALMESKCNDSNTFTQYHYVQMCTTLNLAH